MATRLFTVRQTAQCICQKIRQNRLDRLHVWQKAREHNSFKEFAPHLEKIVQLSRKKADLLGYQEHPYDALLDLYEPEMKTSFLTPLFAKLKLTLTQLLKEIEAKPQIQDQFLPNSTQSPAVFLCP